MHRIHKMLRDECISKDSFGQVLDIILGDKFITQSQFAQLIGYSDSVVSRLINKNHLPRWVDYHQVIKIAETLDCSEQELGYLIIAFICTLTKIRGLHDEKVSAG